MSIGEIQRWTGFMAPNPAMLWLLLEREGFAVFQWTDRVGANYGWHTHQEDQVHWIISGELEITVDINGKYHTYNLKTGDRDLMKAEIFHKARVIGDSEVQYLVGIKRKVEEPKVAEFTPEPKKTKAKTAKAKTPKAKITKPKATKISKKK